MKKIFTVLFTATVFCTTANTLVNAAVNDPPKPLVKIEIPAEEIEKIDIKYDKDKKPKSAEVIENTKKDLKTDSNKVISSTKNAARKTAQSAKQTSKTAATKSKNIAKKTADATKSATEKTVTATKKAARNTVYGTKDIIDTVNPNKQFTKEELDSKSEIKTLKNEKKEIKSAYNSRIKDVDAKIKAAEKTAGSSIEQRNYINALNKEKTKLENEKAGYIEKYNTQIETAKENNQRK